MARTMKETTSTTWKKLAEVETTDFSLENIHREMIGIFGEYEIEDVQSAINEGFIEICTDGFIVWYDGV